MEELTIEEKAKAYDFSLKRAKRLYEQGTITESLSYVFPQLKKLGDGEVRKEIMQLIQGMHDADPRKERWLAWLEKQNPIMAKSPQLGERESTDKVKPMFKVGDCVIDKQGIVHQIANVIENVTNHTYGYDIVGGGYFNDNTEGVRLWTIADVKDGNVLVDVYGNIGIYKSHDDFSWLSYCSLGYYGGFQHFTIEHDNEKTYPATKEQRDTLFTKMKEAGYEWDAEKRELKKISQRMISAEAKEAMYGKPTAWSENDEYIIERLSYLLDNEQENYPQLSCDFQEIQEFKDWLKSLKQRIKL